ncbi:uncharacterized protein [Littorina saxatilis]|uniref:C2H2-type domain-containing protein n=1 Tax=Littorina saxatilis TaxID=31220 RepID=A0AAN9BI70_9CAEN
MDQHSRSSILPSRHDTSFDDDDGIIFMGTEFPSILRTVWSDPIIKQEPETVEEEDDDVIFQGVGTRPAFIVSSAPVTRDVKNVLPLTSDSHTATSASSSLSSEQRNTCIAGPSATLAGRDETITEGEESLPRSVCLPSGSRPATSEAKSGEALSSEELGQPSIRCTQENNVIYGDSIVLEFSEDGESISHYSADMEGSEEADEELQSSAMYQRPDRQIQDGTDKSESTVNEQEESSQSGSSATAGRSQAEEAGSSSEEAFSGFTINNVRSLKVETEVFSQQITTQGSASGFKKEAESQFSSCHQPSATQQTCRISVDVPLPEQKPNTFVTGAAPAKSLRQLSAEGYYRCGGFGGRCRFHSLIPNDLEKHLREDHPYDDTCTCVHCGSAEMGLGNFLHHLEQHLSLQSHALYCSDTSCEFSSYSPEEVIGHMGTCHPAHRNHICWLCNDKFNCLQEFSNHIKRNLVTIAKCPHCSAKDVNEKAILSHLMSIHPDHGRRVDFHKILLCQDRKMNSWNQQNVPGANNDSQGPSAHMLAQAVPAEHISLDKVSHSGLLRQQNTHVDRKVGRIAPITGLQTHALPPDEMPPLQRQRPTVVNEEVQRPAFYNFLQSRDPSSDRPENAFRTWEENQQEEESSGNPQHVLTAAGCPETTSLQEEMTTNDDLQHFLGVGGNDQRETGESYQYESTTTDTQHFLGDEGRNQHENAQPESHELYLDGAKLERNLVTSDYPIEGATVSLEQSFGVQSSQQHMNTGDTNEATTTSLQELGVVTDACEEGFRHIQTSEHCDMDGGEKVTGSLQLVQASTSGTNRSLESAMDGQLKADSFSADPDFNNVKNESSRRKKESGSDPDQQRAENTTGDGPGSSVSETVKESCARNSTANHGPQAEHAIRRERKEQKSPHNEHQVGGATEVMSPMRDSLVVKFENVQDEGRIDIQTVTTELKYWVKRTFRCQDITEYFNAFEILCNYCNFGSRTVEDHIQHLFASHPGSFKGFACCSCDFVSADPDSKFNHKCRRLRSLPEQVTKPIPVQPTSHKQKAAQKSASAKNRSKPKQTARAKPLVHCNLCTKAGTSHPNMRLHVYRDHSEVMVCPLCQEKPANDRVFFLHFRDVHPGKRRLFYTAKVSNYLSVDILPTTPKQRRRSVNTFNKSDRPKAKPSMKTGALAPSTSQPSSTKKTYKCPLRVCRLCQHSGHSLARMRLHVYTEHKQKMKCPKCDVYPINDRNLYQHLSESHEENKDTLYRECRSVKWIGLAIVKADDLKQPKKRKYTNSAAEALRAKHAKVVHERRRHTNGRFRTKITNRHRKVVPPRTKARPSNAGVSVAADTSSREPEVAPETQPADVNTREMEYRCPYCNFVSTNKISCFAHLCCHCHYRRFQCEFCSFQAYSKNSVLEHCRKSHSEDAEFREIKNETLKARVCKLLKQAHVPVAAPQTLKRRLNREITRHKHNTNQHKMQERSRSLLSQSVQIKKRSSISSKSTSSTVSPKDLDLDNRFICPYCKGKRKTKTQVRNEIRFHIHYKPYCCPYCPTFSSSSDNYIRKHIPKAHPGRAVFVTVDRNQSKEKKLKKLFKKAVALSQLPSRTKILGDVKSKYLKHKKDDQPSKQGPKSKSQKHFCNVCPAKGPNGETIPLHYIEDHCSGRTADLPRLSSDRHISINLPSTSTSTSSDERFGFPLLQRGQPSSSYHPHSASAMTEPVLHTPDVVDSPRPHLRRSEVPSCAGKATSRRPALYCSGDNGI